jgi:hypothetical protein
MAPTDGNRALLAIYNQASLDVGGGAVAAVDPSQAKRAALVIALFGPSQRGVARPGEGRVFDIRQLRSLLL